VFSRAWVEPILAETHSVGAIGVIQGSSLSSPFPRYEFEDLNRRSGSEFGELFLLYGPDGREACLDQIVSGDTIVLFTGRDSVDHIGCKQR